VRCASAGAERRGGVLGADPAYVVIPPKKTAVPSAVSGSASRVFFWRAHTLRSKSEEPFQKTKKKDATLADIISAH
jgi:hypothetical protein